MNCGVCGTELVYNGIHVRAENAHFGARLSDYDTTLVFRVLDIRLSHYTTTPAFQILHCIQKHRPYVSTFNMLRSTTTRCLQNSGGRLRITEATIRSASTQTQAHQKRAGDISDAFASLSGQQFKPLPQEYGDLKRRLIAGRESQIRDSWHRLLCDLQEEIPLLVELGSKAIPEIDFRDIDNPPARFNEELKKRGVAVVRGVVSEAQALSWKEELREYIRKNPGTKGTSILPFPPTYRQVQYLLTSKSSVPSRQPAGV